MGTDDASTALPPSFRDAVAASAVMNEGYVEESVRRAAGLDAAQRAQLEKNLDAIAGLPATVAGVVDALALLAAQVAAFPTSAAERKHPGAGAAASAMSYVGICVVHGVVARAARGVADGTELLRAVRSKTEGPVRRALCEEIEAAIGDERYGAALDALGS